MTDTPRVPRAYRGAADAAPGGVRGGQYVADVTSEDAVVFLIGMRINRWRRVRSWWPVFTGMPRMLAELRSRDAGLLDARSFWSGRTFLVVQHWRSAEELGTYARDPSFIHARAWGEFNRTSADTGDVGIFHETYVVPHDRIESVYANMTPFGLAAAHGGRLRGARRTATIAHQRLATTEPDYVED
ncbi:DUF4188 domain-containing protein [Nocardioides sp.]|uniref:DUF4188 domain-containing protein n=1 Tax=Nocardioides sp. TaxID=35761 RepID=UPI003D0B07B2